MLHNFFERNTHRMLHYYVNMLTLIHVFYFIKNLKAQAKLIKEKRFDEISY